MSPTKSAAAESKKRTRRLDVVELKEFVDTKPDDYEIAWNELKRHIIELDEYTRQTVPSVNLSH